MSLFTEKCNRLHAALQGDTDHFRTFGNENAFVRLEAVAELSLGSERLSM